MTVLNAFCRASFFHWLCSFLPWCLPLHTTFQFTASYFAIVLGGYSIKVTVSRVSQLHYIFHENNVLLHKLIKFKGIFFHKWRFQKSVWIFLSTSWTISKKMFWKQMHFCKIYQKKKKESSFHSRYPFRNSMKRWQISENGLLKSLLLTTRLKTGL